MSTTPMFAPDGTLGDIPNERVADAAKAGFKTGHEMVAPDGTPGVIPFDRVLEAAKAGFVPRNVAQTVSRPQINMQPMAGTESLITPAHGIGSLGPGQPEATPGMAAAGVTGLSAGVGMSIPSVAGAIGTAARGIGQTLPWLAGAKAIDYIREQAGAKSWIPTGQEMLFAMGLSKLGARGEPTQTQATRPPTPVNYKGPYVPPEPVTAPPVTRFKGPYQPPTTLEEIPQPQPEVIRIPAGKVAKPVGGPPVNIPMEPAQSTTITSHGYDPATRTMQIQFKNGNVYQYEGVPQEIYNNYRASESQGSFHQQQLKGRYETRLVGKVKQTPRAQVQQALAPTGRPLTPDELAVQAQPGGTGVSPTIGNWEPPPELGATSAPDYGRQARAATQKKFGGKP